VLTVANASDPDSANLTYNFDIALEPGFSEVAASGIGVLSGQGSTAWQMPVSLQENATYYWRAQADDWLSPGPWSKIARFLVNTANDAPTAPVIVSPLDNTVVPALSADIVVNNSTDPDSTVISYFFEADRVTTFNSDNVVRSNSIPEGQGTTLWHIDGLLDNSQYYVRAKASDGSADSPWSTIVAFFANTANDAPSTPVLANPSNGAGVSVFTPILSMHNSTDPDRDVLTYEFEVYADAGLTTLVTDTTGISESSEISLWAVPIALAENQTYYWRGRAYDGSLASDWMPAAFFMINTANDAPGAPTLSSPIDGGAVTTLLPALAVQNAADPDSDTLTYDFEIYSAGVLAASVTGVPGDISGITSATLTTALSDNTVYQWRSRAFDGDRYGPWTVMANFTVHIPRTSINATIDFDPDTLNQTSNGTWVVVYIELPEGYMPADVDVSSIRIEGTIPAESKPFSSGDHDKDGIPDLAVKFRRSDVIAVLPNGDKVPVHVTGRIGAMTFEGVDIIRVLP
jgi:hypothetical protein